VKWATDELTFADLRIDVPRNHADPAAEATRGTLSLFARRIVGPGGSRGETLLFLRGGPGHEAPRPLSPTDPPWLEAALEEFDVVLLDQRGTGLSSPISLTDLPDDTRTAADRVALYRADAIVADAELLRQHLNIDQWTLLGQSYGGFVAATYLFTAPASLRGVMIAGGVPPVTASVDEVYDATYQRLRAKLDEHYTHHPEDQRRIEQVLDRLTEQPLMLPTGDQISVERFQQVGMVLGSTHGSDVLHYLLELPIDSPAFAYDVIRLTTNIERNPLYALLHEAIYADGGSTHWSAHRRRPTDLPLTGEHILPAMFTRPGMQPYAAVADLLADREWGRLYDHSRLADNTVPVAAAVYANDMHVDADLAHATADLIGNMKVWKTDQHEHEALRIGGGHTIFRELRNRL
jgi:pimeloyl-ACP methyl ester carboxylesterase